MVAMLGEPLERSEIVAAQAILGSDFRRESLNLMRCISLRTGRPAPAQEKYWNILFDKKL